MRVWVIVLKKLCDFCKVIFIQEFVAYSSFLSPNVKAKVRFLFYGSSNNTNRNIFLDHNSQSPREDLNWESLAYEVIA